MEHPKKWKEIESGDTIIAFNGWGIWFLKVASVERRERDSGYRFERVIKFEDNGEDFYGTECVIEPGAGESYMITNVIDGDETIFFTNKLTYLAYTSIQMNAIKYCDKLANERTDC